MSKLRAEYQKNWEEVFEAALWAYNTTVIKGHQYSPFFLKYGVEPRLPVNFSIRNRMDQSETLEDRIKKIIDLQTTRGEVMELLKTQYEKRQEHREKHGRIRRVPLQEGDLVLKYKNPKDLQDTGKLGKFWDGPFRVKKALGNRAYKLASLDGVIDDIATAGRCLRKFYGRSEV